jgi:site-specific recombinase XerD
MRNLAYQFKKMCDHNKDGSYSTQASRRRLLSMIAKDVEQLGFRNLDIGSLKPKHVEALAAYWKAEQLAIGTIKNLMTAVRFWAEHVGKENVVKRSNRDYGIDDRMYVTNVSKATVVTSDQLARVTDPYTTMSLRLEREFGLRREESIKIRPTWADSGDRLRLKASWTKGRKYRVIEITTEAQRAALDDAKALAGKKGSLIPKGMRYKDQMERFKAQCAKAGIGHVHGQRHRFAQERYEALTGWKAPACGGPTSKLLTPEQKARDRAVRLLISKELGHEREQITARYLGR